MVYNILFGFSEDRVKKQIEKGLRDRGYTVNSKVAVGKVAIMDYMSKDPSFNVCVLQERMADGTMFTAADLRKFTDERNVNIVIIFDAERQGTSYMKEVFAANILNGIFSNRSKPVFPVDIVDLILHPRNRKMARTYYGILEGELVTSDRLDDEKRTEFLEYLHADGNHNGIGERYLRVVNGLTKAQNIDFIKNLPLSVRGDIIKTKEYLRAKAVIDSAASRDTIISIDVAQKNSGKSGKKSRKLPEIGEDAEEKKKGKKHKKTDIVKVEEKTEEIVPAAERLSDDADVEEYVQNLLRPFRDNRKLLDEKDRKVVPMAEKTVFRRQLERIMKDELIENKRAGQKLITGAEIEKTEEVKNTVPVEKLVVPKPEKTEKKEDAKPQSVPVERLVVPKPEKTESQEEEVMDNNDQLLDGDSVRY